MTSEIGELYQEMILDHNRRPRNFGRLEGANRKAEGYNPLCGDRIAVYLKLAGGRIEEIAFEGSGCAISKASSSLMTTVLKGKTLQEAETLYQQFHLMVTGKKKLTSPEGALRGRLDPALPVEGATRAPAIDKLTVFSGVAEFPARVKCATLAWHTIRAAMDGRDETVSTEEGK